MYCIVQYIQRQGGGMRSDGGVSAVLTMREGATGQDTPPGRLTGRNAQRQRQGGAGVDRFRRRSTSVGRITARDPIGCHARCGAR